MIETIPLEKILVVTFTRAATRDLKVRIRKNMEEALELLEIGYESSREIPDYLKALLEKGDRQVYEAKKRLRQALFTFDQAQIMTIHSFCARMLRQFSLESDTSLSSPYESQPLQLSELLEIIKDYFRTDLDYHKFSTSQLKQYLRHDPDQMKLLKLIQSGHELLLRPSFRQLFDEFQKIMCDIKTIHSLQADRMIEDFQKQAPGYKNYGEKRKSRHRTR